MIAELARGAAAEDAWLEAISDEPGKHALAALIGDADRPQLADDAVRGEMASWIRAPTQATACPLTLPSKATVILRSVPGA